MASSISAVPWYWLTRASRSTMLPLAHSHELEDSLMALDPQKPYSFAPLLPKQEYRRRRRTILAILIGSALAAVGLIEVIASGAFTQHSESARALIAFTMLCWAMVAGFALLGLLVLSFGQRTARRVHTDAAELDQRTS